MTEERYKEITEAARETFQFKLPLGFYSKYTVELLADFRSAFVLGAKWADSHPNVEFFVPSENVPDINIID